MNRKKQKVVLALSGGVDSSLAALLLLEEGYEVIGAFMKNWSDTKTVRGVCSWKEERRAALQVASHLGIPLVTFDFEKAYRKQVIDKMFKEYAAGRTPNPDVLCNSEVKFPLFWDEAKKLGADLIATGHHVRRSQSEEGTWQLLVGKDPRKDQSYFLHQLTQENIAHTLFPIGDYTKEEVRQMARERGIPTADRRSTRGICFVGKVPMPEFLAQAIPKKTGVIKTTAGEVVGEHQGIAPLTIGQRHGFGAGGGTPYYIVEKDVTTNTLVVGTEDDPQLFRESLCVSHAHWIGTPHSLPLQCMARIRYQSQLKDATIRDSEGGIVVEFAEPIRAPAPGQYVVWYQGDICLGGGVIV